MPKTGKITGSRFKAMMTGGRGKAEWGVTSDKLAMRLAAERLGILELDLDGYSSEAMEWGTEQEALAIRNYERKTFQEVHGMQSFQQHPKFEQVGCTPDGLVGDEGMIEVKNPNTENHLFHIINGKQLDEYEEQVQGSLWVTGRAWCDFVSHDSRIKNDKISIDITRVKRDEDYIEEMEERYCKFESIIQRYKSKLHKLIAA